MDDAALPQELLVRVLQNLVLFLTIICPLLLDLFHALCIFVLRLGKGIGLVDVGTDLLISFVRLGYALAVVQLTPGRSRVFVELEGLERHLLDPRLAVVVREMLELFVHLVGAQPLGATVFFEAQIIDCFAAPVQRVEPFLALHPRLPLRAKALQLAQAGCFEFLRLEAQLPDLLCAHLLLHAGLLDENLHWVVHDLAQNLRHRDYLRVDAPRRRALFDGDQFLSAFLELNLHVWVLLQPGLELGQLVFQRHPNLCKHKVPSDDEVVNAERAPNADGLRASATAGQFSFGTPGATLPRLHWVIRVRLAAAAEAYQDSKSACGGGSGRVRNDLRFDLRSGKVCKLAAFVFGERTRVCKSRGLCLWCRQRGSGKIFILFVDGVCKHLVGAVLGCYLLT